MPAKEKQKQKTAKKANPRRNFQESDPCRVRIPEQGPLRVNGACGVMQEDAREEGGRRESTSRTCRVVAMVIVIRMHVKESWIYMIDVMG